MDSEAAGETELSSSRVARFERPASERWVIRLFTLFFPLVWPWGAWLGGQTTLTQLDRFTGGGGNPYFLTFMLVWCLAWLGGGLAGLWALWRVYRRA